MHGCFWHLHENCNEGRIPKSKIQYWETKLIRNVERDKEHNLRLKKMGWKVIVVWECEIQRKLDSVILKVINELSSP
jgi:DNA mismatch endonuclease (patch repair protein)